MTLERFCTLTLLSFLACSMLFAWRTIATTAPYTISVSAEQATVSSISATSSRNLTVRDSHFVLTTSERVVR